MSRATKEEMRGKGMSLTGSFCLRMSLALAVVMAVVSFALISTTRDVVDHSVASALEGAAVVDSDQAAAGTDSTIFEQQGSTAKKQGNISRFDIRFTAGTYEGQVGHLYRYEKPKSVLGQVTPRGEVAAPARGVEQGRKGLLGLIIAVSASVVLVGAAVAYSVANKVARPLEVIVEDVRQIARGDLSHRTRVRGGGMEVALLARSIDRMAISLSEAQDAEVELSVREREREVALEVQEALLPSVTPVLEGFAMGGAHIGSPEPGGDFHDFVTGDGRVVLLVCDVEGGGVPGALIGATARAYLRSELERQPDLAAALEKVNRDLAGDVRRGMAVTALIVAVEAGGEAVSVACAGHKIPLVRYRAQDRKVLTVHPEGIALGFDKGPMFDQRIEVKRVEFAPGDRFVMAGKGAVGVLDPSGAELGEKGFFRAAARAVAAQSATPEQMLEALVRGLEAHADGEPLPADISLVVLARDPA